MENRNTHLAPGFTLNDLAPAPANVAAFRGLLGPGGFNSLYQMSFQQWNRFPHVAREPPGSHSVPGDLPFPPEHRQIGDPHLVICMDCSADTMTNRLLQRNQSSPLVENNTTTIAKRLETYYRASIPVIAYYEMKTQLHKETGYYLEYCHMTKKTNKLSNLISFTPGGAFQQLYINTNDQT